MEGLSARSVVINFFCQLIVFLYLLDNDTSWMIILSAGMGCCIEFWKIGKAMHIEVFSLRFMLLFVYLDFCAMSCTPTCNQLRILCECRRSTGAGVFLSSGSGTENLMLEIKQRSMMIWQCDISPMCYILW